MNLLCKKKKPRKKKEQGIFISISYKSSSFYIRIKLINECETSERQLSQSVAFYLFQLNSFSFVSRKDEN